MAPTATQAATAPAAPTGTPVVDATAVIPRQRTGRAQRFRGRILCGAGLVLLPWLGYLAGTLPPAEAVAWVVLDALEAAALLTAGTRLLAGDARYRAPALAAAVLLVADACADLATAAPGPERAVALAMALLAELPLAALCLWRTAGQGPGRWVRMAPCR
ncbi:hypothetical protein [Streptomyces sp. NPDC048659]|uniref:hypothetical protein n=1 Tax=Streptomyces sp. NPDC048659 TaxID=3155489 RepID=UPI00343AF4E2